jgi:hypothetical protein
LLCVAGTAAAGGSPADAGTHDVPPDVTIYLPARQPGDLPVHQYAYHRMGVPQPYEMVDLRVEGGGCRDAYPCVTFVDGAFTLSGNTWSHHYVIDIGVPDAPARVGARDDDEVLARVEETLRALLADEGVTSAKGDCELAAVLPRMVGLGPSLELEFEPPRPGVKPLVATTVEAAEAAWRKAAGRYQRKEPLVPLFSPSERAQMKSPAFGEARLRSRYWAPAESDERDRDAHFVVLYSPNSSVVYVLDRSHDEPKKDVSLPEVFKQVRRRDERELPALAATLLKLGTTKITLDRSQLCEFAALMPNGGWFPLKQEVQAYGDRGE